jgi:hypothetical protein
VRRSLIEVEEAARVELTEMGGKTLAVALILYESNGALVTSLDKR